MSDHEDHSGELVVDCQVRAGTDLVAHTWDPVVLVALRPGARRRRELRAAIGGISDKVLTETLHRLLANGLIDRRAHAEAPPRVEYALTALGQSLVEGPLAALGRWTLEHSAELLEAQESAARESAARKNSEGEHAEAEHAEAECVEAECVEAECVARNQPPILTR